MNPFTRFLKTNAGFTLTEVMIGGAVLAGIGLAAAYMFRDQRFAQKRISDEQKLSLYHQSLIKALTNTATCNATFSNHYGGAIPAGAKSLLRCVSGSPTCTDRKIDAGSVDVDNTPGNEFLKVGDWTDGTQTWQVNAINVVSAVSQTGDLRLRVTYRSNPARPGVRTLNKDILLSVRFDESGGFRECVNKQDASLNNLQNDICSSLYVDQIDSIGAVTSIGGVGMAGVMAYWDEATQSCVVSPGTVCTDPRQQVYGVGTDGSINCRPAILGFNSDGTKNSNSRTCIGDERLHLKWDNALKSMVIECL